MRTKTKLYGEALRILVVFLSLFLCLFGDSAVSVKDDVIDSIFGAFVLSSRNPGTQWMIFLCFAIYLLTFLFLQHQISGEGFWRAVDPSAWLMGMLIFGTLAYTFNYVDAAQSPQALILLLGAALGSGATVWSIWGRRDRIGGSVRNLIVTALVVLLFASSLWPPEWGLTFGYRGYARWTGPWDYPNSYGLLMGVGIVLALGSAVMNCEMLVVGKSADGSCKDWETGWKVICEMLCLVSAGTFCRGLLHSYSRGAWFGTSIGLVYLATQTINKYRSKYRRWIRGNVCSLAIATISIFALSCWHYRQTEWRPAQRAFSAINTRDFTARNRIAAWESISQIMAEHPWCGVGWNQPATLYQNYYFSTETFDSAPIELNDYLWLGATLGIPALVCFGMYIWLCLRNRRWELGTVNRIPEDCPPTVKTLDSMRDTCRAGAIVLLVGFWFDGGLFRLHTAATFWILIELGRQDR